MQSSPDQPEAQGGFALCALDVRSTSSTMADDGLPRHQLCGLLDLVAPSPMLRLQIGFLTGMAVRLS